MKSFPGNKLLCVKQKFSVRKLAYSKGEKENSTPPKVKNGIEFVLEEKGT